MHVQVNTGRHVPGGEELQRRVQGVVEDAMARFGDRITRVEVHLNDVNGPKPGESDQRCAMEARLAGMQPITVTEQAGTVDQALEGAAQKLQRVLDSTLGRAIDQARSGGRP